MVASNAASAARSKFFLRRYVTLHQRIARGEAKIVKIADAVMPADFLTKWVSAIKLNKSVAYAINAPARV